MRPYLYTQHTPIARRHSLAKQSTLDFKALKLDDVRPVSALMQYAGTRTCDFTVGGIFMWAGYFDYKYSIVNDTVFIKGVAEDDLSKSGFYLPIGKMPLAQSVDMLRKYCLSNNVELRFTAVPEAAVDELVGLGAKYVNELNDWSDYLYDAQAMSTFSGKKLSKKRNHVNRFEADHPDYRFKPLCKCDIDDVKLFLEREYASVEKSPTAVFEYSQVVDVLDHYDRYPFEGAVLSVPELGIVAFTVGEVRDDTLYVHIEKMSHDVTGSGETIFKNFVTDMLKRHPNIRYVNREEDVGDPGLRKAKLAYYPCEILKKYDVTF